MTNKINLVINLSILVLLIYLTIGLNNLRHDFGILTQSLDKVTTTKTTLETSDNQQIEKLIKTLLINKLNEVESKREK
tara:strand:- start:78 stop:311 length:234 start_codon:yes stop_codon:yes gene_type:complete